MKIVWTANALQDADKAFQYAADNFGPIQVNRLADKIAYAETRIQLYPDACPLEQSLLVRKDRVFRRVNLFKHLELVFHKESEEVCLIDALWDTRQDPSKLRRRFK